jgi:cytochrome c553
VRCKWVRVGKKITTLFLMLTALSMASTLHAETAKGDAANGKIRSKAEQCQECHGEAGLGTAEHYPKLAGQWAVYIRKQLGDFQSGARKNEIMTAMAAELSGQDIADIAAYFSSSPRWSGEDENFSATGQALFLKGDSSRGLPACASCHGEKGAGSDLSPAPIPAIGGQRESYLINQLNAFRVDDRANSPDGVMNEIAHRLSEREIAALAFYISGPSAMQ